MDDEVGRVAAEGLLEGGVDAPAGGVFQLGQRARSPPVAVRGRPGGDRHEDGLPPGRLGHGAVERREAAQGAVESDDHSAGAGHGWSPPPRIA